MQRRLLGRREELLNSILRQFEGLGNCFGSPFEVLLEGRSDESDLLLQGRTQGQAPDIDGHVLINDAGEVEPVPGNFYNVEITDSIEYDVIGRIVS